MDVENSQRQPPPKPAPPLRVIVLALDICVIIGIIITGLIVDRLALAWFANMLLIFGAIGLVMSLALHNSARSDPRWGIAASFTSYSQPDNSESKTREYAPMVRYFFFAGLSLMILGFAVYIMVGLCNCVD